MPKQNGALPPTNGKRRRRLPVDGETSKAQMLRERENAHAQRLQERRRTPLDIRISEYERTLTLAEKWDEPVAVVLRACFRFGLKHYEQWASRGRGYSPFGDGDWEPRGAADYEPTGFVAPPPVRTQPFMPPPPVNFNDRRPVTRTVEFSENVFSPPPAAASPFLPNAPTPGSQPMPQEIEPPGFDPAFNYPPANVEDLSAAAATAARILGYDAPANAAPQPNLDDVTLEELL